MSLRAAAKQSNVTGEISDTTMDYFAKDHNGEESRFQGRRA
jgi:hypothetical protein